jgi:uncharacterized protein YkwD
MPRRRLVAVAAALAALALCAPAAASADDCAGADVVPAADNLAVVSQATLCLLNQQRAANGVPALAQNAKLTNASAGYSQRMVDEAFFAHEAPDGDTLVDRLTGAGYAVDDALVVGENIGWGQGQLASARSMVQAWMASPGHRANLLSGDYTEVGLGVVLGTPDDRSLGATYTTDFGERAVVRKKASRERSGARDKASRSCTRAASAGRRKQAKSCARVARLRRR